uniref:Trehalase n=1 Tax=Ditylenchus dipsaci TaxID=166011 RepID=A0A915DHQ2_9BILA
MRSPILFVPFLALQTLAIVLLYIYATYVLFIAVFWPDYFSQNPYVARMNERTARILVLISLVFPTRQLCKLFYEDSSNSIVPSLYVRGSFPRSTALATLLLLRVLLNFNSLARPLQREGFKRFCEENFEQVPFLKPAVLKDWKEQPKLFEKITDVKMKKMAVSLNQIWPQLSREFVSDVHDSQDRYPCTFIGTLIGYLRALGLLFCDMFDTARGILENFAHILKHKSYIPNSGNIGLSRRSQPPLFTQMIWDFYQDFDGDKKAFLKEFLPSAEKELEWWLSNRTVLVSRPGGVKLTLYQYKAETNCPRPENFLEDYQLGMQSGMDTEFIGRQLRRHVSPGWTLAHDGSPSMELMLPLAKALKQPSSACGSECVHGAQLPHFSVVFQRRVRRRKQIRKISLLADHLQADINELLLDSETQECFNSKAAFPQVWMSIPKSSGLSQWMGPIYPPVCAKHYELSGRQSQRFGQAISGCVPDHGLQRIENPIKGYPAQVWEKYDIRFDDGRSGFGGEYPVQAASVGPMELCSNLSECFTHTTTNITEMCLEISGKPFSSTIVLIGLALCVLFALMMYMVQFVWKSRERAVSAAHFWDCQRFEVNDTRLQRDSEHKLLLNTSCDDDSSGNSD